MRFIFPINPILSPTQNPTIATFDGRLETFDGRLEALDLSFRKDSAIIECESRPVRQLMERTTSDFRQLVSPARCVDDRRIHTELEIHPEFHFSPFQPHLAVPFGADPGPSNNGNDHTALATQSWFPILLELSIDIPRLFYPEHDLLTSPLGEFYQLTANHSIRLIAWRLSGVVSIAKVFRQKLSSFSFQHRERTLTLHTSRRGMVGGVGPCKDNRSHVWWCEGSAVQPVPDL